VESDNRHRSDEEAAEQRDDSAEARDVAAEARDQVAAERDVASRSRDQKVRANSREETQRIALGPEELGALEMEALEGFLIRLRDYQFAVAADRRAAAEDRHAAAEDRIAAARDRELAAWARQQGAVEAAEARPDQLGAGHELGGSTASRATESGAPSSGTELDMALRLATARETEALESAQRAADLASAVADSEERIAATLRELDSSTRDPVASERRRAMAEEATQGAKEALRRGERLRGLAKLASEHLGRATRGTLLSHAAMAFAELSRAERSIASAMELLADHDETPRADDYRREAADAAAAAREALERAEELHRLEMTTRRPPEAPQAAPDAEKPR